MGSPSFPIAAPAAGIFPAPAYATYHQSFPFFASPPAFPSPIPAQSDLIWPPAVSPPIHDDLHNSPNWPPLAAHPIPAAAYPPASPYVVPSPAQAPGFSAAPAYHYTPASTAPPATDWSPSPAHHTFFYLPPVQAAPQPDTAPTTPNPEFRPPQSHTSCTPRDDSSTSTPLREGGIYQIKQSSSAVHPVMPEFKYQGGETEEDSVTGRFDCPLQIEKNNSNAHCLSPGSICRESDFTYNSMFPDEKLFHKNTGLEILSVDSTGSTHCLATHQAQTRSSLDSLHGELSKLSTFISQFEVGMGMETTKAPVIGSSLAVASAQFRSPATTATMFSDRDVATSSSVSSLSSPTDASATAYVVPQMFSEMSQSYGLGNLIRQSVSLADGTECSYFTLPADYPLERTTLPMSHSAADSVSVAVPPSLAAHTAGLASVPCSKANNTVNYDSLSAHILQAPTSTQDTFNVCKEMPVYDIYEEDHYCLNRIDEQLAKHFDKASENACSEHLLKYFSRARKTEQSIACLYYALKQQQNDEKMTVNVQQCYCRVLSRLINNGIQFSWDPGILKRMETAVANLVHSMQTPFNLLSSVGQPIDLNCNSLNAFLQVKYCCLLIVWNCLYSESVRQLVCYDSLFSSTTMSVVKLHFTCPNEALVGNSLDALLWSQCPVFADLQYNSIAFCIWDPGIGTSSSISHWLQNLTATTDNTLSSLQTPEPTTWLSQVSSASYAWDPGTMLLLYKSICLLLLREEKEKATLVPEQWIFWFNDVHYCQIFQKCREMCPLMYWHHDIKFSEIALWLITFNPP